MNRIPVSSFLSKWCVSRGIFFDETAATIKSSSSSSNQENNNNNNNNLAIYATRDLEIGEMFSIIPQHATLQASQLSMFSVDGNPKQDPSILPQAVRSIVRGSDAEHPWWELAVLVALHKSVPNSVLENDCLILEEKIVDSNLKKNSADSSSSNEKNNNKNNAALEKIVLPDFSDYLNFLPPESPQEILFQNEMCF